MAVVAMVASRREHSPHLPVDWWILAESYGQILLSFLKERDKVVAIAIVKLEGRGLQMTVYL